MNGFSKLSIISFLMLLLVGAVYFNSQVQFNSLNAQWELDQQYTIQDEQITQIEKFNNFYYVEFDGINDYILLSDSNNDFGFTGNGTLIIDFETSSDINTKQQAIVKEGWFRIGLDNGNLVAALITDNPVALVSVSYPVNSNTRYIVKADYISGDRIDLYIDNVLVSTTFTNNTGIRYLDMENNLGGYENTSENFEGKIYYAEFLDNNNTIAQYDFVNIDATTLLDVSGNNNHGSIYGANIVKFDDESYYENVTTPGIDSYQVFENIRNNAPTANPLSFMDTIITIPQKMVTYTDTFFSWIGFSYKENILEPAAEVSSNLADNYKWYYDLFNWVRGFGE